MNYKKIALISILAGCSLFFASTMLHPKHAAIVNEQGKPSKDLLELLSLTGVEHDRSLPSIVQATQAAWIRKPGIERWEIVDKDRTDKHAIQNKFVHMNLFHEIAPSKKQYDYALWMGGLYERMDIRFNYLITSWQQGVRFDQIVILSGSRPLTDAEKNRIIADFNISDEIPATEADAMRLVYKKINMPDAMRHVALVVIDVPMRTAKDGSFVRPTTEDTINQWMQLHPKAGSCLAVSSQPHVAYQDSVTKTLLPKDFTVETVGPESIDTQIDVYLDTVARLLYQEKKRLDL